jgi:broad specificity phosphatase PhoE
MCNVVVVRPGATLFDEEERIKGSMDMPLSPAGQEQVNRIAMEMEGLPISFVYSAPCESAQSTAREIAEHTRAKWKVCECFRNLDHGLWQGKLVDEVKRQQPRLFRQLQENPRAFHPPGGETIADAEARVEKTLSKLCRKHADETIAIVLSEPLATLVANKLKDTELIDLWKSEQDDGSWEMIDAESGHCVLQDTSNPSLNSGTDHKQPSPSSLPSDRQLAGSSVQRLNVDMPHTLEPGNLTQLRGLFSK